MNNVIPLPTRSITLNLVVQDADVLHELEKRDEGEARTRFANEALRLGVLALRQASGSLDAEVIRRESEKMLASVGTVFQQRSAEFSALLEKTVVQYFDPRSGALPQRLEQLTKPNGDLDAMLTRHFTGEQSTIAQTLAKQVGESSPLFKLLSPAQSDGLLATLASTLKQALDAQRDQVLQQFSLDRKDSALSKLQSEILATNGKLRAELAGDVEKVSKEFSLDNPNGALTRLVKQMDQAQKTITKEFSLDHDGSALQKLAGLLEKTNTAVETSLTLDDEASPLARLRREMLEVLEQHRAANDEFRTQVYAVLEKDKTKREQAARTTLHGHTFEEKVGELLEIAAKGAGDIYEATGQIHGRTQRKRGDHVIELGPDSAAEGACIVCEAKSQKNYTLKDARNEIAEARENRDAEVGLFVFDRKRAPEKLRPLFRIGNDVFVVWDDEDEATDVYLNVAFDLARALARHVREEDSEVEADFAAIDKMLLDLAKHADSLEAIAKAARSVRKNGESILETADAMREALERQVQSLQRSIDALRDADGE